MSLYSVRYVEIEELEDDKKSHRYLSSKHYPRRHMGGYMWYYENFVNKSYEFCVSSLVHRSCRKFQEVENYV